MVSHNRTESARPAPYRRRAPPRLRTKTGCLTCRARRKKCDECRPICVACKRNHIACQWGENDYDDDAVLSCDSLSPTPSHSIRKSSVSTDGFSRRPSSTEVQIDNMALAVTSHYVVTLNLAAYGVRSTQEADLLRHVSDNLLPTLISSYAHPGFRQHGTVLSAFSAQSRTLVDALLAISSLHVSNKSVYYDQRAVVYYSQSLHDLRREVGSRDLDGSQDHLLMTVVWLYIFEIWGMRLGRPVAAAAHLKGALQILKLRQKSGRHHAHTKAIDRLSAESILYHLANIAIYDVGLGSLRVKDVRDVLEPLLSASPFPDSSSIANCPVLVGSAEPFFLAFEASQLSHQIPFGAETRDGAMRLGAALDKTQIYNDESPFSTHDIHTRMMYEAAYLYVLAAKTLLFLLLNPNVSGTHPTVQKYASQAVCILRTGVMGAPCKQFFCWPLLILGPVLQLPEDISFVHHELQAAWDLSSCGNVLVVLQVFETLTQRRMAGEDVHPLEFLKIVQGHFRTTIYGRFFEMA